MPHTHKLGVGNGSMIEHDDGTMSYRATGTVTQAFRVRVADVTGFSVTKDGQVLSRTFRVMGAGTELANVVVNHGTAEKIEACFRAHPDFSSAQRVQVAQAPSNPPPPPAPRAPAASVADELIKLAALRDSGVLTEDEFQAQKTKLLA